MLTLGVLFSFVWIIVGFAAIRLAGQRFFHEKHRADIAAFAVVIAFVAGALWHPFHSVNASAGNIGSTNAAWTSSVATTCYRPTGTKPHEKVLHAMLAASRDYNGNLDVLAAEPGGEQTSAFRAGCNIYAAGWVADMTKKSPAPGVVLVADARELIDVSAMYRQPRPDVVKAFGATTLLDTGFSGAMIPTTGLSAGPHTIQLGALSSDRKSYYLVGSATTITLR
jgi:hypothetical protein